MIGLAKPDRATGALYSVEGTRTRRWADNLGTSNGIAFSPDYRRLYHSDSYPGIRTIWTYDLDVDEGILSNKRVFCDTAGMGGRPDGATVDTDGCYWSASNDGWAVIRYTPAGIIDRVVRVPVSKPSMPSFGGSDLRTLFITSLRPPGLDTRDQELAGGLFAISLPYQGLTEPRFRVPF